MRFVFSWVLFNAGVSRKRDYESLAMVINKEGVALLLVRIMLKGRYVWNLNNRNFLGKNSWGF